jgi:hypothetical protein
LDSYGEVKGSEGKWREVKGSEGKWREVKGSEGEWGEVKGSARTFDDQNVMNGGGIGPGHPKLSPTTHI